MYLYIYLPPSIEYSLFVIYIIIITTPLEVNNNNYDPLIEKY